MSNLPEMTGVVVCGVRRFRYLQAIKGVTAMATDVTKMLTARPLKSFICPPTEIHLIFI